MKRITIIVFSILIPYTVLWAQRSIDPYFLSEEHNKRRFLARNEVKQYVQNCNYKEYFFTKTVNLNNYYSIESIAEKIRYKQGYKMSYLEEKVDSSIEKTSFLYNKTNWKLSRMVYEINDYYKNGVAQTIDTTFFSYDMDDKLSSRITISYFLEKKEEKADVINLRSSQILDSIIYKDSLAVIGYRKKDVLSNYEQLIEFPSPIHIDSILIPKDFNWHKTYDGGGLLKSKSSVSERNEYTYNFYNQLVMISIIDINEHKIGSPDEKLAKPNIRIDSYHYDNDSYLLTNITKRDGTKHVIKYFK